MSVLLGRSIMMFLSLISKALTRIDSRSGVKSFGLRLYFS